MNMSMLKRILPFVLLTLFSLMALTGCFGGKTYPQEQTVNSGSPDIWATTPPSGEQGSGAWNNAGTPVNQEAK